MYMIRIGGIIWRSFILIVLKIKFKFKSNIIDMIV